MNISLPNFVKKTISIIENSGFEAYAVGGSIRDAIRGFNPSDWDLTTNALPENLINIFKDFRVIETGIKHGTVTVIIDDHPIEITTFRLDGTYSDNRHPDSVVFTSDLSKDLSRRDFTVNALAYSERTGIVDLFGGLNDIKDKVIRCVGDPDTRFNEDALRILRALRFSSVLGFKIDKSTSENIIKNCELLKNVAIERINNEFTKLLCGSNVENVLRQYRDVFGVFIPELKPTFGFDHHSPNHIYDVWEHTAHAVALVPPTPEYRVTMLLHDIGKPASFSLDSDGVGHFDGHAEIGAEIADKVMKNMRYSNYMQELVVTLVREHNKLTQFDKAFVKRKLNQVGVQKFEMLLNILFADLSSLAPSCAYKLKNVDVLRNSFNEIMENHECFSLNQLNISGSDLVKNGIPSGEKLGQILNILLYKVIDGECKNEYAELLDTALSTLPLLKNS